MTSFEWCLPTWSSYGEILVLSGIDSFLLSTDWEDHFQGVHQITLLNITPDRFLVLQGGEA